MIKNRVLLLGGGGGRGSLDNMTSGRRKYKVHHWDDRIQLEIEHKTLTKTQSTVLKLSWTYGTTVYLPIPNCTVIYHHCLSLGNINLMQLFFILLCTFTACCPKTNPHWLLADSCQGKLDGTGPLILYRTGSVHLRGHCEQFFLWVYGQRDGEYK